jgi:hypothetical protein
MAAGRGWWRYRTGQHTTAGRQIKKQGYVALHYGGGLPARDANVLRRLTDEMAMRCGVKCSRAVLSAAQTNAVYSGHLSVMQVL